MFKITLGLATVLSLSSFQSSAQTATYTYKLLKDSRDITLPTYSVEDKKVVLDQAYLVMDEIFVHRDLKISHFGTQIDPLPLIKNLEGRVESVSDKEFHSEMAEIFFKQNDLHTVYYNPKPYACYRSLLPFSFKEVINLKGEKVIAVGALSSVSDIIKLAPDLDVRVGDTLISINGVPAYEAARKWLPRTGGANPAAQLRRSISLLSLISQRNNLFPESDTAEIVLKSRNGQTYTVNAPWIARGDMKCLTPEKDETSQAEMGTDDYQIDFNRIYRPAKTTTKSLNASALKDTAEPILKYKIVNNEFGDFGYISLDSFIPEKLTVDETIAVVKNLLQKEFAKTDGLIFDLRNNGGGYIFLAEGMVQLFTPKNPTPMGFILKNSDANRYYIYKTTGGNTLFNMGLREAEAAGKPFTVPLPLNPANDLDTVGQYYFKPVALLTNASCYSSCDMFSAQMQDHGAAIIFGEDNTTGAGGANNRALSDTIKSLKDSPGPYKKLPSGQDLGHAFRQAIRVGLNEGVLLEDRGVLSDKIVPATLSDLYTDSGDQLKVISKTLADKAPEYTSTVKISEVRQDILITDEPKVFVQWENTEKIEFRVRHEIVGTIEIGNTNLVGQSFSLPGSKERNEYSINQYELIGLTKDQRVWRKFFQYRTIPQSSDLSENIEIKLENDTNPLAVYNAGSKEVDGWTLTDKTLRIGNTDQYADGVKTEASLFLNLSETKEFTLNFEASQDSEKDFDFFRVKLTVDGKEVDLIKGLSGIEPMKAYNFDLAAYKGKKVEIRFIFESDNGVSGKGAVLQKISLTSK